MVFSDIGVEIMSAALSQPDERITATDSYPPPLVHLGRASPQISHRLRMAQKELMVELVPCVGPRDDDAWVNVSEPRLIYIGFPVRLPCTMRDKF